MEIFPLDSSNQIKPITPVLGNWLVLVVFVFITWISWNYKSSCSDQEITMYFVRVTDSETGISSTHVL